MLVGLSKIACAYLGRNGAGLGSSCFVVHFPCKTWRKPIQYVFKASYYKLCRVVSLWKIYGWKGEVGQAAECLVSNL